MHISTNERRGFGASVPSLTRASPLLSTEAEGSVSSLLPKLVRLIGLSSTRADEMLLIFRLGRRPPYARKVSCLELRLPSR